MGLFDPLKTHLLDLLWELRDAGLPLTVGGGFGLYLKREHVERAGARTLLDELPAPRATGDLDLFIRTDVLVDLGRIKPLAQAILRLDYQPVPGAEYMQWKKEVPVHGFPREIKLDLLVGPLGPNRQRLHVKACRARPKGRIDLHARVTEEALHIDEAPFRVNVSGTRSSGDAFEAAAFVPHPFPYLMMKLFAFDDRKDDEQKDLGRHHALDLYHIVGMMMEDEYRSAVQLGQLYAAHQQTAKARDIVRGAFSSSTDLGLLRLREHRLFRPEFQLDEFIGVLREVFPR